MVIEFNLQLQVYNNKNYLATPIFIYLDKLPEKLWILVFSLSGNFNN